jgi:hypothetical protein
MYELQDRSDCFCQELMTKEYNNARLYEEVLYGNRVKEMRGKMDET